MKNHLLEYVIEKDNLDLQWDPTHVHLLESLVKTTAQFSVELDGHFDPPSIIDYGPVVQDHRTGSCDQDKIRSWVYAGLLRKAVQDANAVAILRSKSLWGQALNLWRSLFETEVVCHYIGDRSSDDHMACRYAIHSIIRPTVRRWEEFNETCRRRGKPEHYSPEKIELRKGVYREQFGEQPGDYAWTKEPAHRTFEKIAQATSSDMLFYRIASNDVHPTFGEAVTTTDMSLPLPVIPLLPIDVAHGIDELSLEYQTAKSLSNTIRRVTNYATLTVDLQYRLTALKEVAEAVLRDLSRA